MAENISVANATIDDLPNLAHIMPLAMQIDPISNFLFPNQIYDLSAPREFILRVYKQAFSEPTSNFFKATCKSTEQIVAFAVVRIDDGGELQKSPSKGPPPIPDAMDEQFAMMYLGGLMQKKKRHMAGRKHAGKPRLRPIIKPASTSTTTHHLIAAVWNSLYVLPAYQRQGIGSMLIRYGLENLPLDELPIWLCTQMRGRNLYLKFGWEDVDCIDVDLGELAGPNNGYGMHRSPCMVRPPGGKSLSVMTQKA